jgi:hypothetical protein
MNGAQSNPNMAEHCPQCGATLPGGALAGLCPACLLKQGVAADTATQPALPAFEPPPIPELQRLFPQLEILALLGKGGMGAVYKARQPALDRVVALKILPTQPGRDAGFAERFTREARALARLSHPNIVALHEFGQVESLHYFLMEFVDGANLRQLEKTHRMAPREALQIIPQICDALQYAHDEGVVHRDIKPENVLVDRKGRVKIADFGLAKIAGREPANLRLTGEGQVMGTPHYMAPEQIEHPLEVDHRADIYSLGVVFYEMLTGELPLGKFAPPSRKVQVDIRLDDVVLHALEKEPQLRYQNASEVKTAVQGITTGTVMPQGSTAPPTAPIPRWAIGVDYKSRISLWGLPLVHVATGIDPATGKRRLAKGVFALGNVAIGVVAVGGVAIGGIAMGGLGLGVIGIGGLGLGVLALGGLALALFAAVGGGAVAPVAMGGGAIGYYSFGGGSFGTHASSGLGVDPTAWDFFEPWVEPLLEKIYTGGMMYIGLVVFIFVLVPIWLQRRDRLLLRSPATWGQLAGGILAAAGCILPVLLISPSFNLPRLHLVSGVVQDAATGQPLPNAQIKELAPDLSNPLRQTLTDSTGRFAFIVASPDHSLDASVAGFEKVTLALEPSSFGPKRHAEIVFQLTRQTPRSLRLESAPSDAEERVRSHAPE